MMTYNLIALLLICGTPARRYVFIVIHTGFVIFVYFY